MAVNPLSTHRSAAFFGSAGIILCLVLVLSSSGCGSSAPARLEETPLSAWPVEDLAGQAFQSREVLDELRMRAGARGSVADILDQIYDDAGVLASSGDEQAYAVIEYGVDRGDLSALLHYGRFLLAGASALGLAPEPELAARYLLRAEAQGSIPAGLDLCRGHVSGWAGYRPHVPPPGPVALCERMAGRGDLEAIVLSGDVFRDGIGVEPDLVRAVNYYVLAAEADSGAGFHRLGLLAQNGVPGVEPDLGEAAQMFANAVYRGEMDGLLPATALLEWGPPGVADPVRAFRVWELAWQHGSAIGAWGIARAFRCGIGVSASEVEAAYWVAQASSADIPSPDGQAFFEGGCLP